MTHALALLLLAAGPGPATPAAKIVVSDEWRDEAAQERAPLRLESGDDAARLCAALEPVERVRPGGDAVDRGEAEARHETARDAAIRGRYEALVPAAKLLFAPYDRGERRLALQEPAQLPVADGILRLWPTEERGLPVEVGIGAARRLLDAQRRGALALSVVFDLPDDVTCGKGARGKKLTLPVEPVSWTWLDGATAIARGGAAAERPLASAADGAVPRVEVGDPLAGPAEMRRVVAARSADLLACYGEALKRDPGLDGVLVADLGGATPAIAADSVGDKVLAACVAQALATLAPAQGRVAVPIRFELAPPPEGGTGSGAR